MGKGRIFEKWFISPRGRLIEVTKGTHIGQIISEPQTFSLTKSEIVEEYRRHNEPLGFEGWARETIIRKLLNKGNGFVRVYIDKNNNINCQIGRNANAKNICILLNHIKRHDSQRYKNMCVRVFIGSGNFIINAETKEAVKQLRGMK